MENTTLDLSISNLRAQLPMGFDLIEGEDGRTEIILLNQDNFVGWNLILPIIQAYDLKKINLYDFEGKDDVYIEIKNPCIANMDLGLESLSVRFDKKDINEESFDYLKNEDAVVTRHIMSIWKTKLLIFHKGMLRSVSF